MAQANLRFGHGDVEYGGKEMYKNVLDKGRTLLIDHMEPEPIVDIMLQEKFLEFRDCRDIRELPSTTEKNRKIIDKIRSMGEEGYKQFKSAIEMSRQLIILTYLKQLENGASTGGTIKVLGKKENITNQWKDIRDEMITLYQKYYVTTEMSPLFPDHKTHIDSLYVPLEMEEASQSVLRTPKERCLSVHPKDHGRKKVNTFHDILYQDDKLVNTVFITADPGVGKTTLCKKLIATWCKAHTSTTGNDIRNSPDKNTEETSEDSKADTELDNIETMKNFDFLFFVSLSDTSNEAKIEDMITNHIVIDKLDKHAVQYILGSIKFKCLVVLDGLDEWSGPTGLHYGPTDIKGFPKTDYQTKLHILVTTRPWKLTYVPHISQRKHKEIKLIGIEGDNSKTLTISFLGKSREMLGTEIFHSSLKTLEPSQMSNQFFSEIQEKNLAELCSTFLVLKLLLCYWIDKGTLGNSICQIYWVVTNLLIQHSRIRNIQDKTFDLPMSSIASSRMQMPECFQRSEFDHLHLVFDILFPVAKLSFVTLFSGQQISKQKFRLRDLKKYGIDLELLELCSKVGVLSTRTVFGKSFLHQERTIGFLHQSFQEFFAALYFSQNHEESIHMVKKECINFDKVCEYPRVLNFISGMCPVVMTELLDHIGSVAFALDSRSDVDNMRKILSEITLNIGIESLNCNGENVGRTINMYYLSIFHDKFSRYLRFICPYNLKSIEIDNVKLRHSVMHRLLSSCPDLMTIRVLRNVESVADGECGCISYLPEEMSYDISSARALVAVGNKSEIFAHPCKYPYLRELNLDDLDLRHTQITDLLTDSKNLMKVEIVNVNGKKDTYCGCLSSGRKSPKKNKYSCVEELSITKGSGLLDHIDKYEYIEDISIVSVSVSHTMMSRLLLTSKHLKKVKLHDVVCKNDRICGCHISFIADTNQSGCNFPFLYGRGDVPISSVKKTSVDTSITICSVSSVCGIFEHIQGYPKLEELDIKDTVLSHTEITRLLTTSPQLKNVRLCDVNCNSDIKCGCIKEALYQPGQVDTAVLESRKDHISDKVAHYKSDQEDTAVVDSTKHGIYHKDARYLSGTLDTTVTVAESRKDHFSYNRALYQSRKFGTAVVKSRKDEAFYKSSKLGTGVLETRKDYFSQNEALYQTSKLNTSVVETRKGRVSHNKALYQTGKLDTNDVETRKGRFSNSEALYRTGKSDTTAVETRSCKLDTTIVETRKDSLSNNETSKFDPTVLKTRINRFSNNEAFYNSGKLDNDVEETRKGRISNNEELYQTGKLDTTVAETRKCRFSQKVALYQTSKLDTAVVETRKGRVSHNKALYQTGNLDTTVAETRKGRFSYSEALYRTCKSDTPNVETRKGRCSHNETLNQIDKLDTTFVETRKGRVSHNEALYQTGKLDTTVVESRKGYISHRQALHQSSKADTVIAESRKGYISHREARYQSAKVDTAIVESDKDRISDTDVHDRPCREDTTPNKFWTSNTSAMEVCIVEGGNGPFKHIHTYPYLKDLKMCYKELTLSKILNIISESPKLMKLTLSGVIFENEDKEGGCPHTNENDHCHPSILNEIIYLLRQLQKPRGLLITLEDITLLSSDRDTFLENINRLEHIAILDFREMKHPELETENTFILKLEIKANLR